MFSLAHHGALVGALMRPLAMFALSTLPHPIVGWTRTWHERRMAGLEECMAKQEKQAPAAQPRSVEATTYLGHRKDGKWTIWRVTLAGDGSLSKERVHEHPDRRVAREQLRVLLTGKEVLP